jgi:hypothetical protein
MSPTYLHVQPTAIYEITWEYLIHTLQILAVDCILYMHHLLMYFTPWRWLSSLLLSWVVKSHYFTSLFYNAISLNSYMTLNTNMHTPASKLIKRTKYIQNIHNDSQRPDVTALVILLWTKNFWSWKSEAISVNPKCQYLYNVIINE